MCLNNFLLQYSYICNITWLYTTQKIIVLWLHQKFWSTLKKCGLLTLLHTTLHTVFEFVSWTMWCAEVGYLKALKFNQVVRWWIVLSKYGTPSSTPKLQNGDINLENGHIRTDLIKTNELDRLCHGKNEPFEWNWHWGSDERQQSDEWQWKQWWLRWRWWWQW